MNQKENLFEHIAKQMKSYSVEPGGNAWSKLGTRLQTDRRTTHLKFLFRIAVAASIILIASGIWIWLLKPGTSKKMEVMEPKPEFLVELPIEADCGPYCLVLRVRHELPIEYAFPSVKTI
jgi:hypothetical protein